MKRKRIDRDLWYSITQKKYTQKQVHTSAFSGIVSLVEIEQVADVARWNFPCGEITVCDAGMRWLQILPQNEHYLITAMMDPAGRICLWYIDMIDGYGFAEDGVAYFDDLYLDVVLCPDGYVLIDDMDELEQAFAQGDITKAQMDTAIATKDDLLSGLLRDVPAFENFCLERLKEVL